MSQVELGSIDHLKICGECYGASRLVNIKEANTDSGCSISSVGAVARDCASPQVLRCHDIRKLADGRYCTHMNLEQNFDMGNWSESIESGSFSNDSFATRWFVATRVSGF